MNDALDTSIRIALQRCCTYRVIKVGNIEVKLHMEKFKRHNEYINVQNYPENTDPDVEKGE